MKVSELKKGMVLRIGGIGDRCGFVTTDHLLPCGEPELRFGYSVLAPLIQTRGIPVVASDEMIVYLGHDRLTNEHDPEKTYLVRRVLIGERTAVVFGHNFRHLEKHPDFD